jgi:hypothetical protein
MTKQPLDEGETEKALTDYQEGMRLKDGVRAAAGMRMLQSLEGSNLELMAQMFRQDPSLSNLYLYYLEFSKPKGDASLDSPPPNLNAALVAAIAAGDGEATSSALVKMGKVESGELELLAKMVEAEENHGPNPIRFVQRRTGPFVDDLATKAKWFTIKNVYKKAFKAGKMKKITIGQVQDHFEGRKGFGRSSIYEALKYFDYFKKID